MSQVAAGWYPDPMGRYEHRYWDGGQWTEHVSRAGVVDRDPLAAPTPSSDSATAAQPTGTSGWQPARQDAAAEAAPAASAESVASVEPATAETARVQQPPISVGDPLSGPTVGSGSAAPPPMPAPAPPPAYAPQPAPMISPQVGASVAGLAIASMVLGILWVYWIGSILAIIFGHIALGQIKRSNGWKTGRGMAIAGLVLGYVGLGTLVLVIVLAIGARNSTTRFHIDTDPSNGVCDHSRFIEDPDC